MEQSSLLGLLISLMKMRCCENGPKSTGSYRNLDSLVVWEADEPRDLKYKTPEDSTRHLGDQGLWDSRILEVEKSRSLGVEESRSLGV
jgi:hypothetical protein